MIILLTIYGLFLLLYLLFSFFAIYQIWQFGYVGDLSQRIVVLYILVSLLIVIGSVVVFLLAGQTT